MSRNSVMELCHLICFFTYLISIGTSMKHDWESSPKEGCESNPKQSLGDVYNMCPKIYTKATKKKKAP